MKRFVIIILMVSVGIPLVLSMPTKCSVDFSKNEIDCSNREITTSIIVMNPDELMKIKTINFSNNNIKEIDYLNGFVSIEEISFKLNAIENVTSKTFSNQINVTKIDLSFNSITHLDPYVFTNNKNLKSLSLRGNKLSLSAEKPIVCSASLEILDIGTCELSRITRENLLCLPSLKHLELSYNFLSTSSPSVFSPLNNLVGIYLRNNCFKCDCKFLELFKWAQTKKTDLSTSEPCVSPNKRVMVEFEKIEKDLKCSTFKNIMIPDSQVIPDSQKSHNDKESTEFYDYIFVSYDTGVQPSEGRMSTRYMGMISNKLYTIEALLSLVLFLLVIITGMLVCRHYRTVRGSRKPECDYSKLYEPIHEKLPVFKGNRNDSLLLK